MVLKRENRVATTSGGALKTIKKMADLFSALDRTFDVSRLRCLSSHRLSPLSDSAV